MNPLRPTLTACVDFLPGPFRTEHARLFEEEHLEILSARLLAFWRDGVPATLPPPHLSVECTPPLAEPFAFFRAALAAWDASADKVSEILARPFAQAVEAAGCKNLLVLLGQRLTPASLTDARAIPPTRAQLLTSASQHHSAADALTVTARALTKHVHRSSETFWGVVHGSVAEKNAQAERILSHILDHTTWWNVFGHYQHVLVYEARVASGHGARWGMDGKELIGFLEPFEEEEGGFPRRDASQAPSAGLPK